jgi:NADPH2:quinone reductase
MRAIWYEQTGAAASVLQFGELPDPMPRPGEVRVRVHASGINPSDVKARAGARGPLAFPRVIPHSDGAGVIESVGEGVDRARVGERVWLWNAAWKRPFGTCAEFVTLPAVQAVPLHVDCSFSAGACLGIPASTACHAVFCDGPVTGQTVLVTGGAGAVGHYAIQLARWGGARVIATVSGPEKAVHAKSAGVDAIVNYREGDVAAAIKHASGGAGVDRIIEVEFGGNIEVSNAVLKPSGTIVAYGSMAAPTPALPFYPMMFNGVTLRMILVYLLEGAARERVIDHLTRATAERGLNHAIAEEFPLEGAAAAHELVESGKAIGNVVITL